MPYNINNNIPKKTTKTSTIKFIIVNSDKLITIKNNTIQYNIVW